MSLDTAYTDDGRAVICDPEGLYLVSAFEKVDFSEQHAATILEELDFLFGWMEEAQVRLPEPVLIKTPKAVPEEGRDYSVQIIAPFTGSLSEFIEKVDSYGPFTVFSGAPAAKVMGWEEALPSDIDQAYRNFFRTKRQRAIKDCITAGDPLNLFTTTS